RGRRRMAPRERRAGPSARGPRARAGNPARAAVDAGRDARVSREPRAAAMKSRSTAQHPAPLSGNERSDRRVHPDATGKAPPSGGETATLHAVRGVLNRRSGSPPRVRDVPGARSPVGTPGGGRPSAGILDEGGAEAAGNPAGDATLAADEGTASLLPDP